MSTINKIKVNFSDSVKVVTYEKTGDKRYDHEMIKKAKELAKENNVEEMILDEGEDAKLETIFKNGLYTDKYKAAEGKDGVDINEDPDVWNHKLKFKEQDNGTYLVYKGDGDDPDDFYGFIDKETYDKYQAIKNAKDYKEPEKKDELDGTAADFYKLEHGDYDISSDEASNTVTKNFDDMTEDEQREYIKTHMKSKEGTDFQGYNGTIYYLPKDEEAGITQDTTVAMKRDGTQNGVKTAMVGKEDNPINTDSDLINKQSTTTSNGSPGGSITKNEIYLGKVKIADEGGQTADNKLDPELFN